MLPLISMGYHKLHFEDAKEVRDTLNQAVALADQIHFLEKSLIAQLKFIDQRRWYNRYGYRSLRGFCEAMGFSRLQSQRLAILVRKTESSESNQI